MDFPVFCHSSRLSCRNILALTLLGCHCAECIQYIPRDPWSVWCVQFRGTARRVTWIDRCSCRPLYAPSTSLLQYVSAGCTWNTAHVSVGRGVQKERTTPLEIMNRCFEFNTFPFEVMNMCFDFKICLFEIMNLCFEFKTFSFEIMNMCFGFKTFSFEIMNSASNSKRFRSKS